MMNPLFLNLILLGGSTQTKIEAARAAQFDQIELWQQDLTASRVSAETLRSQLNEINLSLTDFQVLLDFDGAPAELREKKRLEAITILDNARRLGASTVLVPASTHLDCVETLVVEDMKWLAGQAEERGLKIAYEAMAWSTLHFTVPSAFEVVSAVAANNLGLVIDAFHIFVRGCSEKDLQNIPLEKIFLVQLSDLDEPVSRENLIGTARHHRLLPGQGKFPISRLVDELKSKGYAGPVGLEVFNDDLKAQDPYAVAEKAMAALKAAWS